MLSERGDKVNKNDLLAALVSVFPLATLVKAETQHRLSVTEIEIRKGAAKLVLNDSIEIKDIELVITSWSYGQRISELLRGY